jgi:hypothetical protein
MRLANRRFALLTVVGLLGALCAASQAVAASGTVTVTAGGASQTYSATLGPVEPDPVGPPAPACGGDAAGCDQQPVVVDAGSYDPAAYVFLLRVALKFTPSDVNGQNCLDVTVESPSGSPLASQTCQTDGAVVTALGVVPGQQYTIEIDADNSAALPTSQQQFSATVSAVATPKPVTSPTTSTPPTDPVTFSHEITVDPQHADGEPDLAISSNGKDMYSAAPYGFSTTVSLMWKSSDGGVQWNNLHGSTDTSCPDPVADALRPDCSRGGGDAEIQLSAPATPGGPQRVQFEDLNGLDTISCSYSDNGGDTFYDLGSGNVAGQVCNENTSSNGSDLPGSDRQWVAVWPARDQGAGATSDRLYMVFDTGETPPGGDAAMTSPDAGVTWATTCTTTTGSSCVGGSNAVGSRPGPLVINPTAVNTVAGVKYPTLYEFMGTGGNGTEVNISCDGGQTWSNIPTSSHLAGSTTNDFVAGAIDSAGELYTVFSVSNDPNPWRLWFAHSTDTAGSKVGNCSIPVQGATWSKPLPLTGPPSVADGVGGTPVPGVNYAVMPWIAAGSPGRLDVVYYGTSAPVGLSPDNSPANWYLYMAQSLDGGSTWTNTQASETPMHKESICFSGIGCTAQTPPGGDRNLLDFFQVKPDPTGRAVIQFVDDNNSAACAPTCTQGAGLISSVQQATGPSLYASYGDVPAFTNGLSQSLDVRIPGDGTGNCDASPCAVVNDPVGDAIVAAPGHNLAGAEDKAADITKLQVFTDSAAKPTELKFRFTVDDLSGGPAGAISGEHTGANWLVTWRWNNDLWYAEATVDPAGTVAYSAGRPLSVYNDGEPKGLEYTTLGNPEAVAVTGSVDTAANTIEIDVPLSSVGGVAGSADRTNHVLYGLTGWTGNAIAALPATACGTGQGISCDGPLAFFDNVDQTAPLDVLVSSSPSGSVPEAPLVPLLVVAGAASAGLGYRRRRRGRRLA